MRIRYFEDTDTLLIELRQIAAAETRDLDDDTVVDLDAQGNVCAITLEHASQRTADSSLRKFVNRISADRRLHRHGLGVSGS